MRNVKNGGILIDKYIFFGEEKKEEGHVYNLKRGDILSGSIKDSKNEENVKNLNIRIAYKTDKKPMGIENDNYSGGVLIVSDDYMNKNIIAPKTSQVVDGNASNNTAKIINTRIYVNTENADSLAKEFDELMKNKENKAEFSYNNYDEATKSNNALVLVISIFLYGFISVITAIGVTNIFNTITTNMNLRSKEFANLKSIGMTKKQFNKMIRLESIFYGSKSLLIGIPIGILLSYLIYKMFETSYDSGFMLPIKAIIITIVFVMIIVGIIMKYSLNKINKQNIIETIRNDNI